MSITASEQRFTLESLHIRDQLQRAFNQNLKRLMLKRAADDGRVVATNDDVRACAEEAFRIALSEWEEEYNGSSTEEG